MKKMRLLRTCLAAVLCLSLLSACGKSADGGAAAPGGKDTLVVAVANEPTTMDPYGKNDSTSANFKVQVFDTLLALGPDGEAVPCIAESWEYTDDTTLVLHIRDGVVFHNGDPLTADDVFYSIGQTMASTYLQPFVDVIDLEKSTVDDEHTITLRMTQPCGPLFSQLCYVYIVPQKYHSEKGAEAFAEEPVGSGPFALSKWVRGDRLEYTANDRYWGAKPSVNKLIMRIIAEPSSRTVEIESGGVDIAMNISASDLPMLEENPDVQILRADSYNNCFIGFDCTLAPYDNKLVRQAISCAIDKESIVQTVYGTTGSVADGPISPAIWGSNPGLKPYAYDPEKAKQLLAEAGYPDGIDVVITTSDAQLRIDIAEMVQNQLAAVGIRTSVEVLENATYLDKIVNGGFQMYILTWPTYTGDADYGLSDTFHTGSATWANTARYSNPDVDALLDTGANTIDQDARRDAYYKAQELIVEDCPWVFLWNSEEIAVARSSVQGLEAPPSGRYSFNKVTFA